METWKPCDGCKKRGTKWITHDLGTDDERVSLCSCFKDYQNKVILYNNLIRANIPESIMDYHIRSYHGDKSKEQVQKLKKYAKEFEEKFSHINLYVYGTNSTQKTTLAHWVCRELFKTERLKVHYALMDKLVKDLIACSFGEKDELPAAVEKYRTVDLLVIDEAFDKRKMTWYKTDFQLSYLDSFLRERLEQNKKATIFVSNNAPDFIQGTFGDGMFELINRNCQMFLMQDKVDKTDFDIADLWKE